MCFYKVNNYYNKQLSFYKFSINLKKEKKPFLVLFNKFYINLKNFTINTFNDIFKYKVLINSPVPLPHYYKNTYFKKKINNCS